MIRQYETTREQLANVRFRDVLQAGAQEICRELAAVSERHLGPRLITVELPSSVLSLFAAESSTALRARAALVFERPAADSQLFGFGEAQRLSAPPGANLVEAMPLLRAHAAASISLVHGGARPRFFGGARFAPGKKVRDAAWDAFGGWQFTVPGVLIAANAGVFSGSVTVRANLPAGPEMEQRVLAQLLTAFESSESSAPPARNGSHAPEDAAVWQGRVAEALAEIAAGRYRKVVLARQTRVPLTPASDTRGIVTRLAERYPSCFIFKYQVGPASWIGASPELLVSLDRGTVRAAALAGSRPRSADSEADSRLMDELLASAKERNEQSFVTAALREVLGPFCSELHAPDVPQVVSLPNVHHLYTPVQGRAAEGVDVLDLVVAAHPTPAVGGSPRTEAIDAIDRIEGMDRGWYAGPIGWMDYSGDGEFAVALRSGLLLGGEAVLYAGAGIVEGSVPGTEFAETEVKLRPLREALSGR